MLKIIQIILLIQSTESNRYIIKLKESDTQKWFDGSIINESEVLLMKHDYAVVETDLTKSSFNDDNVLDIEEDEIVSIMTDPTCTVPWNLDRINQADLPLDSSYVYDDSYNTRGNGIDIYILDTGVNTNHANFINNNPTVLFTFGNHNTSSDTDCQGHGTHVAGSAVGVSTGIASNANLFSIKISIDCTGNAYTSDMILAINYVETLMLANGRKSIINLSFGISTAVKNELNSFISNGGLVVLAAGNDRLDKCMNEKYYDLDPIGGIIVGATNSNDELAWFSNYGNCVDIYAPGQDIVSSAYFDNNQCMQKSGTSMAAPLVLIFNV